MYRWFLFLANLGGYGKGDARSGRPLTDIMRFRPQITMATQRIVLRKKKGLIGLASQFRQKGDSICVAKGATIPLVMRKLDSRW
jgi:hypothetical protein